MIIYDFIIAFMIALTMMGIVPFAGGAKPTVKSDLTRLIQELDNEDQWVRLHALEAIGKRDPTEREPVPALIEAMSDESVRVRVAAAQALLRIGPVNKEVVLAFIRASMDKWKGVIYACDEFFGYLGPQHSYIAADLIRMSKTPSERAQRLSIEALGNMGDASVPAVPYIIESMKNPRLESIAASALRKLGPKANAAVPELIEMLKDKHKKFSAALVLEAIGSPAREAIPELQNCLVHSSHVAYARALLSINPESSEAIDALVEISRLPYVPNQWSAQPDAHYLLVKYGHDRDRHLQGLIDALENPNPRIRLNAAAYLGKLGAEANEAVDSLRKALEDNDPEVRAEAARAILLTSLKPMERKQAADVILNAVEEKVFMARLRAFSALEGFGSDESWAVPALTALATKTTIPQERFRINAVKALKNIGSEAAESLPALRRLLKDDHWQIRKNAHEAIKKIESQPEKNILNN